MSLRLFQDNKKANLHFHLDSNGIKTLYNEDFNVLSWAVSRLFRLFSAIQISLQCQQRKLKEPWNFLKVYFNLYPKTLIIQTISLCRQAFTYRTQAIREYFEAKEEEINMFRFSEKILIVIADLFKQVTSLFNL